MATPHMPRTTVHDVLVQLRDYLGANASQDADRSIKRAILAALREVTNAHRWSYFLTHGRVNLNAQYTTGTVTGDVTGGSNENMLTLASGTWPSWAQYGELRIGTTLYAADQRISDSILTLQSTLAPVSDIAAGTSYAIYQTSYLLPTDFQSMDYGFAEINWAGMEYIQPSKWLQLGQYANSTAGSPRFFTIDGADKVPGRMVLRVFPIPDQAITLDFVYHRRPRAVTVESYTDGTVTTAASSTTVTGSSTAFTSAMQGSVLRIAADALNTPTGFDGAYPYLQEFNVVTRTDGTTLVTDQAADATNTAVKYIVSDPVDVEDGAMLEAFLRCAEKNLAMGRNMKDRAEADRQYQMALRRAKEADARCYAIRRAGVAEGFRLRLRDMPISFAGES